VHGKVKLESKKGAQTRLCDINPSPPRPTIRNHDDPKLELDRSMSILRAAELLRSSYHIFSNKPDRNWGKPDQPEGGNIPR